MNSFLKFLQSLVTRPEKSVATITASLSKTVEALEAYAAEQIETAKRKTEEAAVLLGAREKHVEEHTAASKVAQNIKALLG